MLPLEQLIARLEGEAPGAHLEIVANASPAQQPSLLIDRDHAQTVALFLRDDDDLRFDYASNVTGVDWPDKITKQTRKVKKVVDGVEKEIQETVETKTPGYLEAIYHLYSVARKDGPLVLRLRTENRSDKVTLPSLTPVWRSCEFQEREIFDLFGIVFEEHPDLRRLLMWDGFVDHPMRKDYVAPEDFEYEPTPSDDILERMKRRQAEGAKV